MVTHRSNLILKYVVNDCSIYCKSFCCTFCWWYVDGLYVNTFCVQLKKIKEEKYITFVLMCMDDNNDKITCDRTTRHAKDNEYCTQVHSQTIFLERKNIILIYFMVHGRQQRQNYMQPNDRTFQNFITTSIIKNNCLMWTTYRILSH